MKKEYIEVGNYFIEGFMRGAFDMETMITHIEYKLLEFIPKFVKGEENPEFEKTIEEICLVINRTIKILALKAIKNECSLENFSVEKYLDWSIIEI